MKSDSRAETPARQAWQAGQKKKAHFLAPQKAQGVIQTESGLEASFAFACDLHPKVKSIRPQPCSFDLKSGKKYATKAELIGETKGTGYKPKPYTPDFEVACYGGRRIYVEVRHTKFLEIASSALLLPRLFEGLGLELVIVTDKLLSKVLVHNVRTLCPYTNSRPTEEFVRSLSKVPNLEFCLGDLVQNRCRHQEDVFKAIASGAISVDLTSKRLGPSTLARRSYGNQDHLEVLPL